jgi:histidinol-phosphate aminotransferase
MLLPVSRRRFATALAAGVGAWLLPGRRGRAEASLPAGFTGEAIELNSNENPFGPSPRAVAALREAQAAYGRYPDAAERRLMETLAALHKVTPEQVILGCGSGEVLRMAAAASLEPGRTLVVSEPTFEAVLGYARVTHADPVKVPQTADFRHDLSAMLRASGPGTGLVYVCNPNNPTGTLAKGDELLAFLEGAPKTTRVLVDEAYHHYVDDPGYVSATGWLARFPNLIVARTFSKVYGMAGLRLGYAVGAADVIATLRGHATWDNANAAVLAAAAASLDDAGHVADHRRRNRDTREWIRAELEKDGRRVIPSHANFFMVEIGRDVQPLIDAFAARRILVGRRFAAMPQWLRVSVGTREEMNAFLTAFREIEAGGKAAHAR